jgi:hypothetical protein
MLSRFALRLVAMHVVAATTAGVLGACSGGSGDGPQPFVCPNVDSSCPATPPSYKTEVQPILASRCYGCHGPGGVEYPSKDLSTYTGASRNDIVGQVSVCAMPPPDAGQLTLEERTTLLQWIECGKPNN